MPEFTQHTIESAPEASREGLRVAERRYGFVPNLLHVLVGNLDGVEPLQRRIYELLSDRFGAYFSTVQVETECLETEESAAIDYKAEATPQANS